MRTREDIHELLITWQMRLGLTDWTIAVTFEGNVEVNGHPCQMKIHRSHFYKHASLTVGSSSLDPDKLPECIDHDIINNGMITHEFYVEVGIVHELLHLALRDLVNVTESIEEELHPTVRSLHTDELQRVEEATVQHLAEMLVTHRNE